MREPPVLGGDARRVAELHEYEILDSLPEASYDTIVEFAASVCNAPIALVSLVDESRQWFKSRVGMQARETSRSVSFCAHAIAHPTELLVVPDARKDIRFYDNPLVTGEPFIRFYAGVPLVSPDGFALGGLCVIDTVPRELNARELGTLRIAARSVVALLQERRLSVRLERELEERRRMERRLVLLENVAVHASDGIMIVVTPKNGGEPVIEYVNASFTRLTGYSMDQSWALEPRELLEKIGKPEGIEAIRDALQSDVPCTIETPFTRRDGSTTVFEIGLSPVPAGVDERAEYWIVHIRDVSVIRRAETQERRAASMVFANQQLAHEIERRRAVEERLSFAAEHDALTGLRNRSVFLERLRTRLRESSLERDSRRPFAVMFIDIDRFKNVNDTLGHLLGDELLATIARRLERCVRSNDMVARLGGDEFTILVHAVRAEATLARLADRLTRAVALPCRLGGADVTVSASIGIVVETADYVSAEDILRDADIAMFQAKARGRNRYEFFRP